MKSETKTILQRLLIWLSIIGLVIVVANANNGAVENTNLPVIRTVMVVLMDPKFTEQEDYLIENAILSWTTATNGIVSFIVLYQDDQLSIDEQPNTNYDILHILPIEVGDFKTFYLDHLLKAKTLGYFDRNDMLGGRIPTIFIETERMTNEGEMEKVVEHELGHALGLPHSKEEQTLMYPNAYYSGECITDLDLKAFCQLYQCQTEDLHPCVYVSVPMCEGELGF